MIKVLIILLFPSGVSVCFDHLFIVLNYWELLFLLILDQMIVLSYKPRLKEIKNTINRWSKQTLTPLGKNNIIKTLIISKLNHLFLAIPGPDENMIRQLTSDIYSFIWDDKPAISVPT
jgi:hypothetical protein